MHGSVPHTTFITVNIEAWQNFFLVLPILEQIGQQHREDE